MKSKNIAYIIAVLVLALAPVLQQSAYALVGAHSYTNSSTGDVFLGGDYIELGISKSGSFGTADGQPLPSGFYGTAGRTNIGMSTNPTGFGVAPDLRVDYFMPGSPEERWVVGYKVGGVATTGSNSLLGGGVSMTDNVVTNQSSGDQLKAVSEGTLSNTLKATQVISFDKSNKFFRNDVTLTNIGSQPIDSVRYMRSFDPDNTVDQGGDYTTHNAILNTQAAGDGKAVVIADTSLFANDPVFLANGSRSPIVFYSSDERARVSTFGFDNTDPYVAEAYDDAPAKGYAIDEDQAITIAFDVGTLAPGAAQTVSYYTSLDNRDFSEVVKDIQKDSGDGGVPAAVEDAGPNGGDANGDGVKDSEQESVSSIPNTVIGSSAYLSLQTTGCDKITKIEQKASGDYGRDGQYEYPLGLTDFSIQCAAPSDTATIKIFYDKEYDTKSWVARKYMDGKFQSISNATFTSAMVGTHPVTVMTYKIKDGGPLDADGLANGVIVDPAGPATIGVSAPNTGFEPTNVVMQYMKIILALCIVAILAASALRLIRREV